MAPQLMAGARRGVRTRGKSDPIDALAIARAALREGIRRSRPQDWPVPNARSGCWRSTANGFWTCAPAYPMSCAGSCTTSGPTGNSLPKHSPARRADQDRLPPSPRRQTTQVQIARDMIRRIRELTRATKDLYDKIAALVKRVAPQLLAEPGIGVLLAAKFIGEIAGIDRFTSDAQLARLAGCAQSPPAADAQTATGWTPAATDAPTAPSTCSRSSASATTPAPPSTSPSNAPTAKPNAKRSATSNATSPAASTTFSRTPTASRPPFA